MLQLYKDALVNLSSYCPNEKYIDVSFQCGGHLTYSRFIMWSALYVSDSGKVKVEAVSRHSCCDVSGIQGLCTSISCGKLSKGPNRLVVAVSLSSLTMCCTDFSKVAEIKISIMEGDECLFEFNPGEDYRKCGTLLLCEFAQVGGDWLFKPLGMGIKPSNIDKAASFWRDYIRSNNLYDREPNITSRR